MGCRRLCRLPRLDHLRDDDGRVAPATAADAARADEREQEMRALQEQHSEVRGGRGWLRGETRVVQTPRAPARAPHRHLSRPPPSVSFDIIEIYNTKLISELCEDATQIETTSQECLLKYRDNLEIVFSYAEELKKYTDSLNKYFNEYPSAFTEEYADFFEFLNIMSISGK